MSLVTNHIKSIKPSPTIVQATLAKEMQSKGIDVLNLSIGESDFDTPNHIKEAAHQAIKDGKTNYTPVDGIIELKKAIQDAYKKRSIKYDLNNIIVSCGAKQVIYNCIMATISEGEEVIIPAPYWVSYPSIVQLAKGKTVIVYCREEDGFKLTPELLKKSITNKTKWVMLNSPNNPTGMKYSRKELKDLADVIREHPNIYVMSDDIYEKLSFDDDVFSLIDVSPELANQILIVNGVSKAYAMTGWRIGYGVGPKDVIKAMKVIQSQSTSGPCSISQYAATEAIKGNQDFIKTSKKSFHSRMKLSSKLMNNIDGITCMETDGAFYIFPNCSYYFGKKTESGKVIKDDFDFCTYILANARVSVVAGSAFGLKGYFRLSYVSSEKTMIEAAKRIDEACSKLI